MASIHEEEALGKAYDSRLMKRLLTYLRPYKWQVAFALVAIVLKAATDVVGPYLTKVAIDKYLSAASSGRSHSLLDRWLNSQPLVGIAQIAGLYVALLIFGFFFEFAQTYLMQWTGQKVMFDLRSQIFRHLQAMHIAFFDKNPVGRLVTRLTTDVDALNELFTAGVVSIVEDVFVLAGIVVIMLRLNWRLALIAFAALPLIFIATMFFRTSVRNSYRRIRVAIARINAYLQEHVSGIVVLQLFNREEPAYEKFKDINSAHMEAFKDAIMAHAIYYPVVEIISSIAIAAIIWFGGGAVMRQLAAPAAVNAPLLKGTVTLGVLVAFMQYAQRFFRPIQDLSEKYNILQSAMASSERVFKLLDTPAEVVSPPSAVAAEPDGPGRIEFDHVWFAYRNIPAQTEGGPSKPAGGDGAPREKDAGEPTASAGSRELAARAQQPEHSDGVASPQGNGEPTASAGPREMAARAQQPAGRGGALEEKQPDWILNDVSFTIDPGETVAIVGHTGAGKTTILSLLLRFYDVQRGAIRIDGVDIRELDLTSLRRRFGMVLQDPFLFSGTIEQNIRLGSDWIEDSAVEQACEEVNVADFIRSLPEGLQQPVQERGTTLSTGQKQLISFARALAHHPRILILDEATSSVDTETELRVRDALTRMIEGRTSIVVAHRLSTIQRADKIIVMHKGRVRETGSHQQLLAQRGIYWKLYQLQYKDQEIAVPSDGDGLSVTADN
jgi:ATP-binding cassette subfamily B protein